MIYSIKHFVYGFSPDFSGTSDKRKFTENTDKEFCVLGVRKVRNEDPFPGFCFPSFGFQEEKISTAVQLCCCLLVLFMLTISKFCLCIKRKKWDI